LVVVANPYAGRIWISITPAAASVSVCQPTLLAVINHGAAVNYHRASWLTLAVLLIHLSNFAYSIARVSLPAFCPIWAAQGAGLDIRLGWGWAMWRPWWRPILRRCSREVSAENYDTCVG